MLYGYQRCPGSRLLAWKLYSLCLRFQSVTCLSKLFILSALNVATVVIVIILIIYYYAPLIIITCPFLIIEFKKSDSS